MKKFYTVQVNDPPSIYSPDYFPRKFRYERDAIAAALAAVAAGATMARVEYPVMGERDFYPEKKEPKR
jgi:hypothetical protein